MNPKEMKPGEVSAPQRLREVSIHDVTDALARMAGALESLSYSLQKLADKQRAADPDGAEAMAQAAIARAMRR